MTEKSRTTRVGAYGLLTKDNQILLCRLSDKVPRNPGKWTLPGGGIEFGESPEEAAAREILEETGLSASIGRLLEIDSMVLSFSPDSEMHSLRAIYTASVVGGSLRNEVSGTTDMCQWWGLDELPDMVGLAALGVSLSQNMRDA
jgi:ADP-ribose pyrophosphatase YjhB (NUDIX family)